MVENIGEIKIVFDGSLLVTMWIVAALMEMGDTRRYLDI